MTKAQNCGDGTREDGFTLIELMVTIVVAAVLLAIAVPSFNQMIQNSRLATAVNAVIGDVNVARMNAIKLNSLTQFCGSTSASNSSDTLGAACATAGAVYALPLGATSANVLQAAPQDLASVAITSAGMSAIRFSGEGFGYDPTGSAGTPFTGTLVTLCSTHLSSNNRRVISMSAGSVISTTTATGSCS